MGFKWPQLRKIVFMDHENTSRQLASQAYRLPIEDQEFLLRDELRGLRFQLEYSKTELLLRDWGIRSTIIVFGSARVPSPEQAEMCVPARQGCRSEAAQRRLPLAPYYEEARKFGRIVSLQGGALNPKGGMPRQRDRDRRRSRHHGGRQPRRVGSQRADDRLQHRAAARAISQPLHHAGPDLPLPLLRHAQDASGDALQCARGVSRRLRHA